MASFSNKSNGSMLKCKPRKVSAARVYPPGCGWKSGETSVGENVVMEAGDIRNLGLRKAVLPGSDGISETELMNSVGRDKINATGKDMKSGAVKAVEATSRVEMQKKPSWRNKYKAVARKTIPGKRNSGSNVKVALPWFGPKNRNSGDARSRVKATLMRFRCICLELLQEKQGLKCKSEKSNLKRVDLVASETIKREGKDVNTEKQILGEVPGVEVGDVFQYRAELAIVGMHRHYQAGIDSMEHEGVPIAISIVTSGSYNDETERPDVLIYCGHGGNMKNKKEKNHEDQKLEGGNLALSNSVRKGTPVRVVREWEEKVKGTDPSDSKCKLVSGYYYDGLYTVKKQWQDTSSHGKLMYKFRLTRNPGQPELAWKELKKGCKSKARQGIGSKDISDGNENFPVWAVNVLDEERPPNNFTYISKMMYPDWYRPSPPMVCACVGRCNDFRKCGCAIRNGDKIPYTLDGLIAGTESIVYECGPQCKCLPTCYNRVTQRGIKVKLEIFKTNRRGWGLRALTYIPYGTFICEYAGELLEHKEAEQRIGQDEYLFGIGQSGVDSSTNYKDNEIAEENRYTIDARRFGNLGRFINHSCSPNLCAQYVIYDHNDDRMPHVMFFAAENIPPLKELTFDYNYKVIEILDSKGNVKNKKCFCGSADCSRWLY